MGYHPNPAHHGYEHRTINGQAESKSYGFTIVEPTEEARDAKAIDEAGAEVENAIANSEEVVLEEVILEEAPLEEVVQEEVILEETPLVSEDIAIEEVILEEAPLEEVILEEVILEEAPSTEQTPAALEQ